MTAARTVFVFSICCVSLFGQQRAPATAARGVAAGDQVALRDASFSSASLGRAMKYRIFLPAGYERSVRRYPVLYLLHGLTGAYSDWESRTHLAQYAQSLQLIIVMPDAGDSWYTNSVTVPEDKFEDYIANDLIWEIDQHYRTIASRHGRAIAGLSMGGYGALKLGLKYPGLFAFAASFSGALDVARNPGFAAVQRGSYQEEIAKIFGPADSAVRKQNDVFALAQTADPSRLPFLYFDCGAEDPFANINREFAALLQQRKIAHEYRDLPGTHNWQYWDQQLPRMLRVMAAHIPIGAESGAAPLH